jgi:hypothetical protein
MGGGWMLDAERRKRQWLFFSALFLFTQMRKNPERRERERGEGEDPRTIRREGRERDERKTLEESREKGSSVRNSHR